MRILYKRADDVDDALQRQPASPYWRLHLLAAVNWLGQVTPARFLAAWCKGIDLPYPAKD